MNFFEELKIDFKGKVVLLDIDGTLLPDDGRYDFEPSVINHVDKLKENNRVFLCTNTNDKIRNTKLAEILKLPVNRRRKKPNSGILKEFGENLTDQPLVVIGDKFLTDWFFAKNIGAEFIKVKRKISGKESLVIKLINFADDLAWQIAKLLKFI